MIPDARFSSQSILGNLLNPLSLNRSESFCWGPIGVQNPTAGNLVQVWHGRVGESLNFYLSSPNTTEFLLFSRATKIFNVSLSFDLNGSPCVAFQDNTGSYLYWFDPVPNAFVFFNIPGISTYPAVTLDEYRAEFSASADVILGYIRADTIRYRQLRDRFTIEYTPTVGDPGLTVRADILYHISLSSVWRLEFYYGLFPQVHEGPDVMKLQIIRQKAPVEILELPFNFDHLLLFGDTIISAMCTITVQSGIDPSPESMKVGAATFDNSNATQTVQGGVVGVIYLISMAVRTTNGCILVSEGSLSINNSVAVAPALP